MKRTSVTLLARLCPFLWLCSAFAQESLNAAPDSERARVFITDSQSWSIAAQSGGAGGAFGGTMAGGARPQTAEIIKTFGERCPEVTVNNIPAKTDYIVLLDHEGGKGILQHKNKVAVFARVSGDSIVSKSTLSLGGSVQNACEAIVKDWTARGPAVRAAAAASAEPSKPAVTPQTAVASGVLTSKLSATLEISSTPPDADIELDGSFTGNTPSSVGVEAGEHTIKISKNGFNPWERKIKSSTGTVRVSASLDPIRAATSVPASSAAIQQEIGEAKSAEVGRASIPATTNSSSASAPAGSQPRSAALASSEPPPSSPTSTHNPGVNAQAPAVEEERPGTAPAKNSVMNFLGASSDEKNGERHDGVRIVGVSFGGPADHAA